MCGIRWRIPGFTYKVTILDHYSAGMMGPIVHNAGSDMVGEDCGTVSCHYLLRGSLDKS